MARGPRGAGPPEARGPQRRGAQCSCIGLRSALPRKGSKIVTLHEHTAKTYKEISGVIGVSLALSAVSASWNRIPDQFLRNAKGCGREKKTNPRGDAHLLRQSQKDPRKTGDPLNSDLKEKDIQISSSAVRRRLIVVDRKARRPVKKTAFYQSKARKAMYVSKKVQRLDKRTVEKSHCQRWNVFLWTGSKKSARSKIIRRADSRFLSQINQFVKHPQKKMFWRCFIYYGVRSLRPIEGIMRSPQHHGRRKGGQWGLDPLDFENFSKKCCFLRFEWEKQNFTSFGNP